MTRRPGALVAAALLALALYPAAERARARWALGRPRAVAGCAPAVDAAGLLRVQRLGPLLASWQTVGGCGAAGSSASGPGGGIKWVGRNVTGGLVDAQCLPSQTYARGNYYTTVNTRLGTSYVPSWSVAIYLPVLYKVGDVTVLGDARTARVSGFGDVSAEVSRKLGADRRHQVSLIASAPTGSYDAVRQGIVLPQHLQLGSGVPGFTGMYEQTRDQDWGLVLVGATASYGGWRNPIGDRRAPSGTVYAHAGYIHGPLVPSAGLTLFAKPEHDVERGAPRSDSRDPLMLAIPSAGLEWSSDSLAVYLTSTVGLSYNGFESVTVGLGVSSSLF